MRLALDTNRFADFMNGDPEAKTILEGAVSIAIPFAVLAELRVGFRLARHGAKNEHSLEAFCRRAGVSILYPDEQTTRHYATLKVQLRQQGTPIPINDLWIAALVIQHGLTLYSRDQHFDHLPQLPRR